MSPCVSERFQREHRVAAPIPRACYDGAPGSEFLVAQAKPGDGVGMLRWRQLTKRPRSCWGCASPWGSPAASALLALPRGRCGSGSRATEPSRRVREATFGGEACPAIDSFSFARPSRIDAELLILCNALREGGAAGPAGVRVRSRTTRAASPRRSPAGSTCRRRRSGSTELDGTRTRCCGQSPVIQAGEWQLGLYTTENRADVLAVRTLEPAARADRGGTAQLGRGLAGAQRHRPEGADRRAEQ